MYPLKCQFRKRSARPLATAVNRPHLQFPADPSNTVAVWFALAKRVRRCFCGLHVWGSQGRAVDGRGDADLWRDFFFPGTGGISGALARD